MANEINNNMLALLKGDKGEKGDGLEIKKWYASTEEMNADYSNPEIAEGDDSELGSACSGRKGVSFCFACKGSRQWHLRTFTGKQRG